MMLYLITNILRDNVRKNIIYHIMKKPVTNNVLKYVYRCCTNQRRYLMNNRAWKTYCTTIKQRIHATFFINSKSAEYYIQGTSVSSDTNRASNTHCRYTKLEQVNTPLLEVKAWYYALLPEEQRRYLGYVLLQSNIISSQCPLTNSPNNTTL
jgi:hypothetical protein